MRSWCARPRQTAALIWCLVSSSTSRPLMGYSVTIPSAVRVDPGFGLEAADRDPARRGHHPFVTCD